MNGTKSGLYWTLLTVTSLSWAWAAQTIAQTGATSTLPGTQATTAATPQVTDPANPPAYIREMVEAKVLTQEQLTTMLTSGYGWGEVRIAALLAQQMVANSTTGLTFEEALGQVTTARAEGKGFGQIAADNNLRIGGLVGQRNGRDGAKGPTAQQGNTVQVGEEQGGVAVGPDPANPPAYIRTMVQDKVLTQEQVNAMLTTGYGWGEVRIAALMAQQMVANSTTGLTFEQALGQVMTARAEGKDFGQIAAQNNLKMGELLGQKKAGAATAPEPKKPGFFARLGRFFGFGRSQDKPAGVTRNLQEGEPKTAQGDKPERPVRVERAVRAERPERPETPARMEKPERPERPGGGPNR